MLEQLTIKNVAVIDKLTVTFGDGLSVLTGETGAGKSIIIDSINMILGARANKDLVRNGEEYAFVEAVFSMTRDAKTILDENEIDCDDDCVIITRKVTNDGKSSARVNGCAVTANTLRDIADTLINIHGQHDNRTLLTPSRHIHFLDSFAKCQDELGQYTDLYRQRIQIEKELRLLKSDATDKLQKIDLLSYQVNEIKSAELSPDEEDELVKERDIQERAEEITVSAQRAYECLYSSDTQMSAYDCISGAVDALGDIADVDNSLKEVYDSIVSAMYTIEDGARTVRDFAQRIEFDQSILDDITNRLDLINRLKRKYGGTVSAVIDFGKRAQEELSAIETSDERVSELERELSQNSEKIQTAAQKLSKVRAAAAKELQSKIETALHELNMEKARFCVGMETKEYGPDGIDSVEFLIATNPGEALKPLVKIASGGELSRVMLAIKSILADADNVDAMIFDEIDTGVSGSAAERIADKLKKIAKQSQVICITHLPQLASAADTHFLIEKDVDGALAKTTLTELDTDGRIAELARIVGGGTAGEEYAREVLKRSL